MKEISKKNFPYFEKLYKFDITVQGFDEELFILKTFDTHSLPVNDQKWLPQKSLIFQFILRYLNRITQWYNSKELKFLIPICMKAVKVSGYNLRVLMQFKTEAYFQNFV